MLLVFLRAIVAAREREDQRVVALKFADLAQFARVIGQFVVGENASGHNIRTHGLLPFLSNDLLSEIQSDTRVWLGTAYEHVPRSRSLQRFWIISNRSANQTGHAGMTDASPARPSDRDIARFRQFKQARKFRIPRGRNPATRECHRRARSGRPWWQVRSVNNLRHTRANGLERTEDFRV